MLREQSFDGSEIAIASFLQAKAYGKPFVLLPVVLAARFQEPCFCASPPAPCAALPIWRAAAWGSAPIVKRPGFGCAVLAEAHGVRPETVRWITFEDAHVAEYRGPPWVERAPLGADLLGMLRQGAWTPSSSATTCPPIRRCVRSSPTRRPQQMRSGARTGSRADQPHADRGRRSGQKGARISLRDLVRMFRAAEAAEPGTSKRARYALDATALTGALQLILRYARRTTLLPRRLSVAELLPELPATDDPRGRMRRKRPADDIRRRGPRRAARACPAARSRGGSSGAADNQGLSRPPRRHHQGNSYYLTPSPPRPCSAQAN